jgi:chemosensory pili system protein ChpC
MNGIEGKVRSLWIPLRDVNMLLPNVAVAEVNNYHVPEEQPDTPDWMLGSIVWREQTIPVISLEALCGHMVPTNLVYSRLMIVNSVRPDSTVQFYAIVAAGLPRLIQFDNTVASGVEPCELPALQCRVFLDREQAVIPDLDYIQGQVEQHWAEAA